MGKEVENLINENNELLATKLVHLCLICDTLRQHSSISCFLINLLVLAGMH